MRREKAELEGKTSPATSNRVPPPAIGLGSGILFPQLTPGVRDGKPLPGTVSNDQYMNNGAYTDGAGAKRPRQDDPYSSRGSSISYSQS